MTTEVWFRNPSNYIRELAETESRMITWDRGLVYKRRIDPYKHALLYFGGNTEWRVLMIGRQGSAELRPGFGMENPYAVYPTWEASESLELLEEMMAYPLGEDEEACSDQRCSIDERPVFGQEHRVVITGIPPVHTGPGRALVKKLQELQEDYPECIMHLHNLYSYRTNFGMGFRSADVDPRTNAGKGKVYLPSGKEMIAEKTIGCPQWVTMLGFKVVDLKDPRKRCIFNIKSAEWAGEHFEENIKFKATSSTPSNPDKIGAKPATTQSHMSQSIVPKSGDKLNCDTCSLQNSCKYFRTGAVCSVPGSEPAELANYFKTRDSSTIIEGLGTLLAAQTRRMERGIREEQDYGELNPEVTKMMNQIFTNGTKLAQLVDPGLRGGAKVQVNVGNGAASIGNSNPKQLMGAIVAEFEARGVARGDITPDMIQGMLSQMANGSSAPKAIEGQVIGNAQ